MPVPGEHQAPSRRRIWIGEDDGRRALLVDGVVQSVAAEGRVLTEGYWAAMLPDVRPDAALVLGYGGGTLAHLLQLRFGPLPVIGVDDDPDVLALAAELGGPLEQVEIVLCDAFQYVQEARRTFGYISVDLFRGGEIPRGMLGKPFLRRLRRLLGPGGSLSVNLFADRRADSRLHRLGQMFEIRSVTRVGKNLVVHAR